MSLSQAKFNILRDYLWFPLQTGKLGMSLPLLGGEGGGEDKKKKKPRKEKCWFKCLVCITDRLT